MEERITSEERRELFGEQYDAHAVEAAARWGETDAYKESARRSARYSHADWVEIRSEMSSVGAGFVEALRSGEPPSSLRAMDAAEAARLQIDRRFYSCPPGFHRVLADMYVTDPRFARTYEQLAPGLARYVRAAIHANADRQELSA